MRIRTFQLTISSFKPPLTFNIDAWKILRVEREEKKMESIFLKSAFWFSDIYTKISQSNFYRIHFTLNSLV